MSKFKSLSECIIKLNSLLITNVENLTFNEVKKLIRKRHLQWHPDKNLENPNLYREQWITLFKCWKFYEKNYKPSSSSQPSTSSDSENLFSDSEVYSDEEFDYNQTPFSDDFFHPSPKKDFEIPESHKQFYRSTSNRRAGKTFLIYCLDSDKEKLKEMYFQFSTSCDYYGLFLIRTNKQICCLVLSTLNEYRNLDMKKFCRKYKLQLFKVEYAVKIKQLINFCVEKHGEPWYEPCNDQRGKAKKEITSHFNNNKLVKFALINNISNVYTLMSKYSHLATPCPDEFLTNEHKEEHLDHMENAIAFNHLSDRQRAAKNAINCVSAERFELLRNEKPWSFLERKAKEYSDKLIEINNCEIFGEAYLYSHHLFKKFKPVSLIILNTVTEGRPRKRWTLLTGPYKSGKTSFASAFCKFLEGVNININVDKNRLSFFLGNAIGRRFVLFDDVKGRTSYGSELTAGTGFKNLDDLRDHLDGHIEVQLEKKNQQPIEQIFPPGIITCNDYIIEPALLERINGPIKIKPSEIFSDHEMIISPEIIFIGLVLYNMVPVESHVMEHITTKVYEWKEKHRETCDCLDRVSIPMGAVVGTLFAVAGTVLLDVLATVPAASAAALLFFADFAATTAVTAVGVGGALVDAATFISGTVAAVQALQGGVAGVLAYLGAGQLITYGTLTAIAAGAIFAGGVGLGVALGSGNTKLVRRQPIQDFLFTTRRIATIYDVIKQLRSNTQTGQFLRLQTGQKRSRPLFNNELPRSVSKRVRR